MPANGQTMEGLPWTYKRNRTVERCKASPGPTSEAGLRSAVGIYGVSRNAVCLAVSRDLD